MFASLAVGGLVLSAMAVGLRDRLIRLVQAGAHAIATGQTRDLVPLVTGPGAVVLAISAAACVAALVAGLAQTGGGFWFEKAMPDLTKVFNPGRVARLFKA